MGLSVEAFRELLAAAVAMTYAQTRASEIRARKRIEAVVRSLSPRAAD